MENKELNLTLSPSAANRIIAILRDHGSDGVGVRLEVLGGGCSGFQYKFGFSKEYSEVHDVLVEKDGAKLIVDKVSYDYLKGSEIDYKETVMEAGFKIKNPNATAECGCGSSFAVDRE